MTDWKCDVFISLQPFLLCKNVLVSKHPAVPQKNGIDGIFLGTRCGVAAND